MISIITTVDALDACEALFIVHRDFVKTNLCRFGCRFNCTRCDKIYRRNRQIVVDDDGNVVCKECMSMSPGASWSGVILSGSDYPGDKEGYKDYHQDKFPGLQGKAFFEAPLSYIRKYDPWWEDIKIRKLGVEEDY